MKTEHYEPKGLKFYDHNSKREMMLVTEGHAKDWIVYRHPDGQWVTLRKATDDDLHQLAKAMSATIHTP
jgi:hypothetical protein